MKTKTSVETKVAHDDVDDIVEIATRLMYEDDETLSVEELREVGEDLDIPEAYLDRAREELERRRTAEKRAERDAARRKRTILMVVAGLLVTISVGIGVVGAASIAPLNSLHAQVEAQRAQVENVRERKKAIEELYRGRPASPDRDAELIGAENRVRVETKRYAELAAQYNARASGLATDIALVFSPLPGSVPAQP